MLINEQLDTAVIANPLPHLPSVSTDMLINLVRVDKTMGHPRISYAILSAYDVINGQLAHEYLQATWIADERWLRAYERAVLYEAGALLAELYSDFDTIGNGLTRADNDKIATLRRMVNHAVADLTAKSRNRIRLL